MIRYSIMVTKSSCPQCSTKIAEAEARSQRQYICPKLYSVQSYPLYYIYHTVSIGRSIHDIKATDMGECVSVHRVISAITTSLAVELFTYMNT